MSAVAPQRRVVALGASNVRIGFPPLVAEAQRRADGPVDLLAAMGHGRSYGHSSRVAGRSLPGILQCGIWKAIAERPSLPTTALVTDIGNDLLYGDGPKRLVAWVGECVDRLLAAGAEVALTELPLPSLTRLGPVRYRLFRTLFFPACRLTLEGIAEQAHEVNNGLLHLAQSQPIVLKKTRDEWYGFDPIHLKRAAYSNAWEFFLEDTQHAEAPRATTSLSLASRLKLGVASPEERRLFGVARHVEQPGAVLSDGTCLSLF